VQLIPRNTFLRLYAEINDGPGLVAVVNPVKRSGRRPKKAAQVALSSPPPKQEAPKGRKPSPVAEKCLSILLQHGPLTSAELSGHLYPEVAHRFRVQNFSALSLDLRKKEWVEKRTEPATGIDKWFLTEAGKEQL